MIAPPAGPSVGAAATVRTVVAAIAQRQPDDVALVAGGESVGYGELLARIDTIGRELRAAGVGARDRVAIVLPDGLAAAIWTLAVASYAVACPLNPRYREAELAYYFSDLEALTLVTDPSLTPVAPAVARAQGLRVLDVRNRATVRSAAAGGVAPPDAVALMLHTSGTTSRPKLVPLTHGNLTASAQTIAAWLELTPADRCLGVMPLFHIHGLIGVLLSSLAAGASVACTDGFLSTEFFGRLRDARATWYSAVPTMHQAIVARATAEAPPRPLRFVRSSSAPLAPRTARDLQRLFGSPVIEAYGMTEAAHQMCSNPLPPREQRFGSVGLPSGVDVAILGEDGAFRTDGGTGEVAVRGPSLMSGYAGNDAASAAAFVRGWFRTGDLGRLDRDGYLFLTGRLKEIINRGGEKISPREIDEALLEHPAVAQAVTFAIPDERLGEEIGAAIVHAPGRAADAAELQRFVRTRLADFKIPRRIVFLEALPLGPTGKLQRTRLAAALGIQGSEAGAAAPAGDASPSEATLQAIWCEVLRREACGRDEDFFALGGDSLLAAQVIARVRRDFARELTIAAFFGAPTIAAMAHEIDRAPAG